jgi:hypothetical protein
VDPETFDVENANIEGSGTGPTVSLVHAQSGVKGNNAPAAYLNEKLDVASRMCLETWDNCHIDEPESRLTLAAEMIGFTPNPGLTHCERRRILLFGANGSKKTQTPAPFNT